MPAESLLPYDATKHRVSLCDRWSRPPAHPFLLWLLLVAVPTVGVPEYAAAQVPLGNPRLEISGPTGQFVVIATRYFDSKRTVKTVHSRLELSSEAAAQPLDFGHAALRIKIVAATAQPITARLLDGDQLIAEVKSQHVGVLELEHGPVPAKDDLQPPRALLSDEERTWVRSFLSAISNADTRALVSSIAVANIDWQTLNAYSAALTRELGRPLQPVDPLDGWIGWEGSIGARVFAGSVPFEDGRCHFKLMVVDGKLVDVEPSCSLMPDDWFVDQPQSTDAYVEQAHQLARALFEGEVAKAQRLFARQYHQEVTLEVLEKLRQTLNQLFGSQLRTIELKRIVFGPAEPESLTKQLGFDSTLTLESGKRCISRVDFVVPSGPHKIGRADLVSINIVEAWQSASPALADQVTSMLEKIGVGDEDANAQELLEAFHPQVAEQLTAAQLSEFLKRGGGRLGALVSPPDFDLWKATAGPRSTAAGTAVFAKGEVAVEANFAEDKLLGITLFSESHAASTLDLIPEYASLQQHGLDFWQALLSGRLAEAHQRLAADFQEQLPLAEFEELVAASQLMDLGAPTSITVDTVRLSHRDDRGLPVMLAAYLVATLDADQYLSLVCEFTTSKTTPGTFELLNFSTDGAARFPLQASAAATRFFDVFLSADVDGVMSLCDQRIREQIDPAILRGYLKNLTARLDRGQLPTADVIVRDHSRLVREYTGGRQLLHLQTQLDDVSSPLVVTAEFDRERLQSFQFQGKELASFVEHIGDMSGLKTKASDFVQTWLAGDLADTEAYLVAPMQTPATQQRLGAIRTELNTLLGAYLRPKSFASLPLITSNQVQLDVELEFERGTRRVRLTFDINAFFGLISGVGFDDAAP